jgi:transposase
MATVTVLSGPERRRRWASSEKASIVEESLRPGAMVTAVARRHDVHPNLLHHWRRQARRGLEGGQGLKLLPVVVAPTARSGSQASGSIEIELGDARVRVDSAVDEVALGRVLRVLRALGALGAAGR